MQRSLYTFWCREISFLPEHLRSSLSVSPSPLSYGRSLIPLPALQPLFPTPRRHSLGSTTAPTTPIIEPRLLTFALQPRPSVILQRSRVGVSALHVDASRRWRGPPRPLPSQAPRPTGATSASRNAGGVFENMLNTTDSDDTINWYNITNPGD